MKTILLTLFMFFSFVCSAQNPLIPAKNAFEKKWIKDQSYSMQWFALRDTTKMLMGEVTTKIVRDAKTLTIVTSVAMKNNKTPWIDSTLAKIADLSPIRHSSYNGQRDMVLNFAKTVTGYYHDKAKNTRTKINDIPEGFYFDSNLYPTLVTLASFKRKPESRAIDL